MSDGEFIQLVFVMIGDGLVIVWQFMFGGDGDFIEDMDVYLDGVLVFDFDIGLVDPVLMCSFWLMVVVNFFGDVVVVW